MVLYDDGVLGIEKRLGKRSCGGGLEKKRYLKGIAGDLSTVGS